jgi:hypothetical protein
MAKSRAERKAAKAAAQVVGDHAAMTEALSFGTVQEANEALASVAKVVNMQDRKNKEGASVTKKNEAKAKKQSNIPTLMALPKLPRGAAKPRPTKPCACGCETPTKGTWAPGHDSNFRAWVLRVERGVLKVADIPHEGLRAAVKAEVKLRATVDGKSAAAGA